MTIATGVGLATPASVTRHAADGGQRVRALATETTPTFWVAGRTIACPDSGQQWRKARYSALWNDRRISIRLLAANLNNHAESARWRI
ncbi:hypothetical protein [Burkholderia cepacia]|uniref:hypothetical protein n=1 Tax=Burkholderia cepacia TaxID=292 RepID=UPI0012DA605F|nr:hypothetical protein [Burkholderia cepacia]MBJ9751775.1 hypothetical protein [Burkholderia cepacia]MCA8161670.1 hypothetical protein [Burkholderia cepacia]